jgi:hypothetical protein
MSASVLNKTMDERSREVMDDRLLRAKKHERFVQEEKRLASHWIQLMEMNRCVPKHCGDVDLEPILLTHWKVAL